jgi:hypothetical protein
MTAPAPKLATVDDLLAIPEDERRHELIEGVIEPKGAASGRHGASQRKLSAYVEPSLASTGGHAARWRPRHLGSGSTVPQSTKARLVSTRKLEAVVWRSAWKSSRE